MKATLLAAILFPITFLILSHLFEDSPSSIKEKKNVDPVFEYNIECQYNTVEVFTHFEVCPHQTNHIK